MAFKPIEFNIDTTNYYTVELQELIKRGDILQLSIKVFDKSILKDLTGQKIDLTLKKADNTLVEYTLESIIGETIIIKLKEQSTLAEGLVIGELCLRDNNGNATTNTFVFYVRGNLTDELLEESKDDVQTFADLKNIIEKNEEILKKYSELIDKVAGTTESVQALESIKKYIDTNLQALGNQNSNAVFNITELKKENDRANINISTVTKLNKDIENLTTDLNTINEDSKKTKDTLNSLNKDSKITKDDLNNINKDSKKTKDVLNNINVDSKITKCDLESANIQAEKNIEELTKLGDATDLAKKVETKMSLFIGETLPEKRDEKTLYFKVTDNINSGIGISNVKVSPAMGIKLI